MMHTIAEFMFWAGRIETIVVLMVLVHVMVLWILRSNVFARGVTALWLLVYVLLSFTVLYGWVAGPATEGVDSMMAHLYEGLWTDPQALSAILARWQSVWLPIYIPWLGLWIFGLLVILFLSALQHQIASETR